MIKTSIIKFQKLPIFNNECFCINDCRATLLGKFVWLNGHRPTQLSNQRGIEHAKKWRSWCTQKRGPKPLKNPRGAANLQSSQTFSISRACENKLGCVLSNNGKNKIYLSYQSVYSITLTARAKTDKVLRFLNSEWFLSLLKLEELYS